jgi:hypothetical protein
VYEWAKLIERLEETPTDEELRERVASLEERLKTCESHKDWEWGDMRLSNPLHLVVSICF